MQLIQNLPDVLDVRFRQVFYDRFDKVETTYDRVVKTLTSDRNYEKYGAISGVGEFTKLSDEETVTDSDFMAGFDKTFTHERYSNSVRISKVLLDDDQFGVVSKESASLAKSAKRNIDEHMAQMFFRGFLATNKDGGTMVASDNVRHFSTLHYKNPSEAVTYSNASSSGIPLNETNLETGLIAVSQQLNPQGKLGYFKADTLLVPTELRKTALILLDSNLRPDTADNDANVYNMSGAEMYYGKRLNMIVWDQLSYAVNANVSTSNTHWYLLDTSADAGHQLSLVMREQPNFSKNSPIYVDENRYWKWIMDMRYSYGMQDWRGVWASKGDSQAYSS